MAGRSIAGQVTQIKREATPGTANTTAMLRVEALKMRPGFTGDAELFRGLSGKMATTVLLPDIMSAWTVQAVQDFNAIGYVAASRIDGTPVTTPGTLSFEHVFTLNPDAEDTRATYTAQYGDSTAALQAVYGVFNSMGVNVQRGQLGFDTSFIAKDLTSVALAGSTVDVPAVPIPPRAYDIWLDDSWANLGTTQALAVYQANASMGDKFAPDSPINSSIVSFESLLEAEEQDHPVNFVFGFDSVALDLITSFKDGDKVYIRTAVEGSIIEGIIPYSLTLDYAAHIVSIGEVSAAPNSPAVSIPMTLQMARESATEAVELTLVNTVASYA